MFTLSHSVLPRLHFHAICHIICPGVPLSSVRNLNLFPVASFVTFYMALFHNTLKTWDIVPNYKISWLNNEAMYMNSAESADLNEMVNLSF